jgi:hypothetical protein
MKRSSSTSLDLVWGADNIARALNLKPGPTSKRKIYHLSRTGKLPGLKSIGNRLVLDPGVTRKMLFENDSTAA